MPVNQLPLFSDYSKSAAKAALPSYIRDHRKRLRHRFQSGGPKAVADYELLELILFRAIPRQDVKPLARTLLNKFGGFADVIGAPVDSLCQIPGVADAVITELKIIEAAATKLAQTRLDKRQVLSSWTALLDYCQIQFAHKETEHFHVFFLDRQNRLIADEEQARGSVGHVPVYPREIIRRALQLNASALILVHNHPSGETTPSDADISTTQQVVEAGAIMGITIHDHLIIGRGTPFSFRNKGLLN